MLMPQWLEAGAWAALSSGALLIGALITLRLKPSKKIIGFLLAFGAGILVSTLSFDLMEEAYLKSGIWPTALGVLFGSILYTAFNIYLTKQGAKRFNYESAKFDNPRPSPLAQVVGTLIDGIPESFAIGVSLIENNKVSWVAVLAIFLSNISESIGTTNSMLKAEKQPRNILSIWIGIIVICILFSVGGNLLFAHLSKEIVSFALAVAAGGILSMIVTIVIPEAFEEDRAFTGIIVVIGFLLAFVLTKVVID